MITHKRAAEEDDLFELCNAALMDTPPGTAEGVREAWGVPGESFDLAGAPTAAGTTTTVAQFEPDENIESNHDDMLLKSAEEALEAHRPLDACEAFTLLFAMHELRADGRRAVAAAGARGASSVMPEEFDDNPRGGDGGCANALPHALACLPTRISASPVIFAPAGAAFLVAPRGGGRPRARHVDQEVRCRRSSSFDLRAARRGPPVVGGLGAAVDEDWDSVWFVAWCGAVGLYRGRARCVCSWLASLAVRSACGSPPRPPRVRSASGRRRSRSSPSRMLISGGATRRTTRGGASARRRAR